MHGIPLQKDFPAVEGSRIGLEVCVCQLGCIDDDFFCFSVGGYRLAGSFIGDGCLVLCFLASDNHRGAHSRHLFLAVDLGDEVMDDVMEGLVQNVGRLKYIGLESRL